MKQVLFIKQLTSYGQKQMYQHALADHQQYQMVDKDGNNMYDAQERKMMNTPYSYNSNGELVFNHVTGKYMSGSSNPAYGMLQQALADIRERIRTNPEARSRGYDGRTQQMYIKDLIGLMSGNSGQAMQNNQMPNVPQSGMKYGGHIKRR